MILSIVQYGDPILRTKGKRIEKIVRLARKGRKSLAILVDARETCWACIYGRYRGAERT